MGDALVYIAYPVATLVVFLFGVFAMVMARLHLRKVGEDTTEFFLTARNSASTFRIAWSFYAGVMGSWALFSAPSYAYAAGILGMVFYSVFAGAPIIIVGFLGIIIQDRIPRVFSFSDYVHRRFGRIVQLYVSAIMLVTMGTALTVEYTTVGSLFTNIINTTAIPVVIIIGVISSVYAAYGGLHISLITDQVQAGVSLVLVVLLFSWVAAKFRTPLGPLTSGPTETNEAGYDLSASNYTGLASIASMPISLIASAFFSEGPWQRCWASANHKTLRRGAIIGAIQIMIVVFLFSFGGFLAAWSGLFVPSGPDDYGNTILFTLLSNQPGGVTPTIWITVVVACLSVTMTTSAVDNYQNAIADNIAGVYLKHSSVWWTRLIVLLLNIPCIVVSLRDYNVISLFLLTNLLNATAAIPILMGLWRGRLAQRIITPASCLFGCILGVISLIVYAAIRAPHWGLSTAGALKEVFFLDLYNWPPFIIAPGFSVVGVVLMAGLENLIGFPLMGQYDLEDIAAEEGEDAGEPIKPSSVGLMQPSLSKIGDEEGVEPVEGAHPLSLQKHVS